MKDFITKGLVSAALVTNLFTAGCSLRQPLIKEKATCNLEEIVTAPQQPIDLSLIAQHSKVAVVLIDMQDTFLKHIPCEEKKEKISYQLHILDYCRTNNIPVYVLEFPLVRTRGYITKRDRTISLLQEKINTLPIHRYIFKQKDGFKYTNLENKLKQNNIQTLLLTGIYASACVKEFAEGALERGFNIMTSKQLLFDLDDTPIRHQYFQETIDWFKENGIYRDSYLDLIKVISPDTLRENISK